MTSLKWFHDFFREFLGQKQITIKEIANGIGMEYNHFLNIIHGDDIKNDVINDIISLPIFDNDDKLMIQNLFKQHYLKNSERSKVIYIEKMLMSLYETLVEQHAIEPFTNSHPSTTSRTSKIENVVHVINNEILKAYNNSIRESMTTGDKVKLEIHMHLPTVDKLLHGIYHYLKDLNQCLDKKINMHVFISIDYDECACESKLACLLDFSKFIKFVTLSDFVTFKYVVKSNTKSKYFIVLPNTRLVINDKATQTAIYKGDQQDFLNKYIHTNSHNLAKKMTSEEYFNYLVDKGNLHSDIYSMTLSLNSLSVSPKLFNYRLNKIKDKIDIDFSEEEKILLKKYNERIYFKAANVEDSKTSKIHYVTKAGLLKFMDTCIINEFYEVVGELDQYEMISLIYKTLLISKYGYELRILDHDLEIKLPFINVLKYFDVHVDGDEVIITRSINTLKSSAPEGLINLKGQIVEYAMVITDKAIVNTFKQFCKYALDRIAYPNNKSFDYLRKLANTYFGRSEIVEVKDILDKINHLDQEVLTYKVI